MTRPDLDALAALLAKATPGPWDAPNGETMIDRVGTEDPVADAYHYEDAALIVAAVNALPALIARVRELERERDEALAERDALRADAERYRWLRDGDGPQSSRWSRWRIEHWASPGPTWADIRGADLDAAIDAARAKVVK